MFSIDKIVKFNELDDFTFDKEYSEKIKTRIAKTEQEVRRLLATQSSAMLEKNGNLPHW